MKILFKHPEGSEREHGTNDELKANKERRPGKGKKGKKKNKIIKHCSEPRERLCRIHNVFKTLRSPWTREAVSRAARLP